MISLKSVKDKWKAMLFLSPALLIYIVCMIVPLVIAIYFSFSTWSGISGTPVEFIGIGNYLSIFRSSQFLLALKNMAKMVFFSVLFHTPIALLLAVAINARYPGTRFFKTVYFLPTVLPLTVIGLLWYFILMPNGSLNFLLDSVGLRNLINYWLIEPGIAMNSIIFVNIWAGIGYYMVILVAGLTTIPEDIYEAAAIDGANGVRRFFHITIPLLKPVIGLCLTMDIIGTIKVFDLVFVMTEGGPRGMTHLPTTLMYNEAFRYDNYGVGSAIGVMILVIALILTITFRKFSERNLQSEGS